MIWAIFVGLGGLIFILLGIRHNKEIHRDETGGSGILGDSLIFGLIIEGLLWILEKMPFWVTRKLYFSLAIFCFYWSYRLLIN
jgi:hypothetical protein